jgi:IPT/TIG domain-containing protein
VRYPCGPVVPRPARRTVQLATWAIVVVLLGLGVACGPRSAAGASSAICTPPLTPPATGHGSIPASFAPQIVARRGLACIVGNGFGATAGEITFFTGGSNQPAAAVIRSWSNTLIEMTVPSTAVTGPVEGETSSGEPFYVGPAYVLEAPNGVAKLTASPVEANLAGQPVSVRLLARDSGGRFVKGARVIVSDGLGSVSCTTDASGTCELTIEPFQSATLIAISGTAWTEVKVPVIQPPDERMTLVTSSPALLAGETATLTATVKDAAGHPVFHQQVDFSTTGQHAAVISPASSFTDSTGAATTTITSTSPDWVIVEADTNDHATIAVVDVSWSTSVVSSISPVSGPLGGSTEVTIAGRGFVTGALVYFGNQQAVSVTFVSSTMLRAISPAGEGGVDVRVEEAGSDSSAEPVDVFTYGPPVVMGLSPATGPSAGGTPVTISGVGFAIGAQVFFGSVACSQIRVTSSKSIDVIVPPGSPGIVDVTVITPAGTSARTSSDRYSYSS